MSGANIGDAQTVDLSPKLLSITKSDTTLYNPPLTGIVITTTAGDVKVLSGGNVITIPEACLTVGVPFPGSFSRIYSTDTTAVGILGWQR